MKRLVKSEMNDINEDIPPGLYAKQKLTLEKLIISTFMTEENLVLLKGLREELHSGKRTLPHVKVRNVSEIKNSYTEAYIVLEVEEK